MAIEAFLSVRHQRDWPAGVDLTALAANPDDILFPIMSGVDRPRRRQAHDEIDVALAQFADQRIVDAHADIEPDAGPLAAESRERARQNGGDEIAWRANAYQMLGSTIGTADVHDLVVDRQQAPRIADGHLAVRRQADARHAAVEDVLAEQILQPLDLRADGRLSDAERGGCFGETTQIDDRNERP
jgi:hypothetical protein